MTDERDARANALLHAAREEDGQRLKVRGRGGPGERGGSPGDLEVHWLHGDADEGLAEAIAALDFPPGTPQVFLHGEATSVRLARRHLVIDRAVPTESLSASGYWKRTLTDEGWREAKRDWNAEVEAETAGV